MQRTRILEINPSSAIIKEMHTLFSGEKKTHPNAGKLLEDLCRIVHDNALLASGYSIDNVGVYSRSVYNLLKMGLGIKEEDRPRTMPKEPQGPTTPSNCSNTQCDHHPETQKLDPIEETPEEEELPEETETIQPPQDTPDDHQQSSKHLSESSEQILESSQ